MSRRRKSNSRNPQAPHEPTAWWRERIGAAEAEGRRRERFPGDAVTVNLWAGEVEPGSREDRTCDRCRTYVPGDKWLDMFTLQVPGTRIMISGALCEQCMDAEHMRPTIPVPADHESAPLFNLITTWGRFYRAQEDATPEIARLTRVQFDQALQEFPDDLHGAIVAWLMEMTQTTLADGERYDSFTFEDWDRIGAAMRRRFEQPPR